MKRLAKRTGSAASSPTVAQLVELRDDLAAAKNTAAAAYMACQGLTFSSNERAAMCEVVNACREKLESIICRLDDMLANAAQRPSTGRDHQP